MRRFHLLSPGSQISMPMPCEVEGASAGPGLPGPTSSLTTHTSLVAIRYAVMEFGGFLGMGTDRYPIPWTMLKYDTSQDGYVVPLDKAQLDAAPRYVNEDVPEYDDTYRANVDKYYGL
jgi:hypothetical protein